MMNFGSLFVASTVLATALMTPAPAMAEVAPATADAARETTSLTIELSGFQKIQGQVFISIYDAESAYNGAGGPVSAHVVPVDEESETLLVQLPGTGTYGFRMFHDVDGDGEMDTNLFGMPTEPFAFSNNARGSMGPAKWDKVAFTVEGATTQSISFR
jgi:uncharacterized protein (DUF2141 family)